MNESKMTVTRREALWGATAVATLAAAEKVEKLADGDFAEVSYAERPDRGIPVLPPGAVSRETLMRRCVACGLCMKVCPEKIIRPSTALATLGRPELDFRHGYCLPSCVKCGSVCPTGAIAPLQEETKANVHMGVAVWRKDLCIRTTANEICTACVRECPVRAIHLVAGFPVVDESACVGCGACEHACPARPLAAISVKGLEMQRTVRPLDAADLLAEMRDLLAAGDSVVLAHKGVIDAREMGRGIAPLLALFDRGALKDAVVCDKVIGRAAAALCLAGGATRVYGELMSEGAVELLKAHGVESGAAKVVPQIDNRTKTGPCPVEQAVSGLTDPTEMIAAIRAKLNELR